MRMRADWTGNVADEPLLFKRSITWKPTKAIDHVTRVRAMPSFSPLRRTDLSAPRRPLRRVRMSVHCSRAEATVCQRLALSTNSMEPRTRSHLQRVAGEGGELRGFTAAEQLDQSAGDNGASLNATTEFALLRYVY
jgi:hypothetical protein